MDWFNSKKELLRSVCKAENIYLYGAGKAGILVYLILKENGLEPAAFIETRRKSKYLGETGIPIIDYKSIQINADALIIVCAIGENRKEIISKCTNIKNLLVLSDAFFELEIKKYSAQIMGIQQISEAILYKNEEAERSFYLKSFNDVDALNDKKAYLLNGLDTSSHKKIEECLNRIKKVKEKSYDIFDIFNESEKKELVKCFNYFKDEIAQISDHAWCFRGYYLPINDFRAEIFYDKMGLELIENCGKLKNSDFIDIGGYIGDSAIVMSKYTTKKIHVFEPISENYKFLEQTIKLNHLSRVVPNQMAVSDHNGKTEFLVNNKKYVSGLKAIGNREYISKIEVPTTTLDSYVEKDHMKIGLIKIHAEGAEQDVIRGAEKIIREQSPVLIIEINHTESDFFDIKPLLEHINPDYKFKICKPTNGFICLGLKLIAEVRK